MLALIAFSFQLSAQITGTIIDDCTGEEIQGLAVSVVYKPALGIPIINTDYTDSDGEFFLNFPVSNVLITITVNGYQVYLGTYSGSLNGTFRYITPLEPLVLDYCNGELEGIESATYSRRPFVGTCKPAKLLVDPSLRPWVNPAYSYDIVVTSFFTNQLITEFTVNDVSPCHLNSEIVVPGAPCLQDPFNVNNMLDGQPADVYRIEVTKYCCGDEDKRPFHKRSGLVTWSESLDPADADFRFTGGSLIENINNDNFLDGLLDLSSTRPGPELGDVSVGFNAGDYTSGTGIDEYTVIVERVQCSGNPQPQVLFSESYPAPGGDLPVNYVFSNEWRVNGVPYFLSTNTTGVCYKLRVIINNACGDVEQSSYFTITDQCTFCFTQEEKPDDASLFNFANALENTEYSNSTKTSLTIRSTRKVNNDTYLYPNPAHTFITINKDHESAESIGLWTIYNTNGQAILTGRSEESIISIDIQSLDQGMYFYKSNAGVSRFMKQ